MLLAALLAGAPSARADGVTTIRIDAAAPLGPVEGDLVGVGWHPGGPPLSVVADLEPAVVRIDASLQDVSPAPGELHLGPLLARVAEIRAIGAEPLVILSYMPAWLGAPNAAGRDPTRVPPADPDAWERLVHDVVHALATAPEPARRFEAWNEPDIPIFWQDTPEAWSAMVARTARAIAAVEAETGIDLAFGGPATAVPDPVYLEAFLRPLRADPALPLDFVSWHYYANTPFLGPDGNEFAALDALHPLLGRRNPLADPAAYGTHARIMRDLTAFLLVGTGRPQPTFIVDEWNLSPGGYDRRHDSHEGAAFAAAVLVEMQEAGLDESAYFQVDDESPTVTGGHGLVRHDGTAKPAWWAFRLWREQPAWRVRTSATPGGLWATAAEDGRRLTVLLASFSASLPRARTVELVLDGLAREPGLVTVRRIDAEHSDAATAEPLALDGGRVRLELPAQAVALVEVHGR